LQAAFPKPPERFKKSCSHSVKEQRLSGLFGFWRRFGSVAGFLNLRLRRSLAKNQKSSLRIGYNIF